MRNFDVFGAVDGLEDYLGICTIFGAHIRGQSYEKAAHGSFRIRATATIVFVASPEAGILSREMQLSLFYSSG